MVIETNAQKRVLAHARCLDTLCTDCTRAGYGAVSPMPGACFRDRYCREPPVRRAWRERHNRARDTCMGGAP